MNMNHVSRRVVGACTALLLVATMIGGYWTAFAQQSHTKFLPLVVNGGPIVTQFGVQADAPNTFSYLRPLNVEWLRFTGPSWNQVESTPGGRYNWDVRSVDDMDQVIASLRRNSISPRIILISIDSPRWATVDGSTCGPLKPEAYDDYARFMAALAKRYITIQYFELGNEPDIDVDDVNPTSGFGCWGDKSDQFYGGRAYGEMLKVVYPAIKQENPKAQVLNGGLLLDRPYDAATDTNRSALFMEGVFATGAASSFDILNYHSYTYYQPSNPTPDGVTTVGNGADDWKARYLREMMQRYGVAEKPLVNTETALLCNVSAAQLDRCREAQANMVGRAYARAASNRLLAATWYTFSSDGFGNTSFLKSRGEPQPVYGAFKQAREMLGGSVFQGALPNQASGVEGYQFKNGSLRVTIFWSDQGGKTATVAVPRSSTPRCMDRDGTAISCRNTNGVVSLPAKVEPTYVVVP